MKMRRVKLASGEEREALYETEREGKRFVGTVRECLLFGMGYGTDQAAELRYEMARLGRSKNKNAARIVADAKKAGGVIDVV